MGAAGSGHWACYDSHWASCGRRHARTEDVSEALAVLEDEAGAVTMVVAGFHKEQAAESPGGTQTINSQSQWILRQKEQKN